MSVLKKINWQVRIKNRLFWTAIIPATLLLIQSIASAVGVQIDVSDIATKLVAIVNAAFAVLAIAGITADPTTEGIEDSEQAMHYVEPKKRAD